MYQWCTVTQTSNLNSCRSFLVCYSRTSGTEQVSLSASEWTCTGRERLILRLVHYSVYSTVQTLFGQMNTFSRVAYCSSVRIHTLLFLIFHLLFALIILLELALNLMNYYYYYYYYYYYLSICGFFCCLLCCVFRVYVFTYFYVVFICCHFRKSSFFAVWLTH